MLERIKQKVISGVSDATRRQAMLTALALLGIVMTLVFAVVAFGLADTNVPPGSVKTQGHPGYTGWRLTSEDANGSGFSIDVHHVIAGKLGIFVVYSARTLVDGVQLSPNVQTKRVTDGVASGQPSVDLLVATTDEAAVRIASLGAPTAGATRYGMSVSGLSATSDVPALSLSVIEDETPNVVEGGVSFLTNTNPDVAHLLHDRYGVIGPQGITFGILPSVAGGDSKPSYYKISPGGSIQEITVEELKAFNQQHRR